MTGHVYAWNGALWRVIAAPPKVTDVRALGFDVPKGARYVRNVLIERLDPALRTPTGERAVRPFRGLRRPA